MDITEYIKNCMLCPRNCRVNRAGGKIGRCGMTDELQIAKASLHFWEEPCISGEKGSGAVFFSGCALGCVYCQNFDVSHGRRGKRITIQRLSEIFIELQNKQAHNINLVTPGHFVPQIIAAIDIAKEKGLEIPVVYNTSGYEKKETIKLLEGYIDVYLPDFKYMDSGISKKYSDSADYSNYASEALAEMVRQVGSLVFDNYGLMKKGVIVRHLMLPGCIEDSKSVIKYLYQTFGNHIYLSIMNQYTPYGNIANHPELHRQIRKKDYDKLIDYAISLGVENAFIQEGRTASESFIPDFDYKGV